MMNANDILIDILEDNRRRLCRGINGMSNECLAWQFEAGANNILVTMWHMARILDVFLILQAEGRAPVEECWFNHGWAGEYRL